MAANVTCPMCGHQCNLLEPAGAEMRCPACFSLFPVKPVPASPLLGRAATAEPAAVAAPNRTLLAQPETMVRYNCPRCKKSLESPASFAGQKLNCPDCNQRLQIPQLSTPSQPPLNKTMLATEEPAVVSVSRSLPPSSPPPAVPTVKVVQLDDVAEAVESATLSVRECCLECGVDLSRRARVQTCPDCGSLFCSAACYREHHHHAHARKQKKRSRPVECEYCGSTAPPYRKTEISQSGWITFALLMVFFFPLFWIGLLMTETQWFCADCGRRLD